jgi:hypothetical protein
MKDRMAKAPQKAQRKPVEPPKPASAMPVAKIEAVAPVAAPVAQQEPSETPVVEPFAPSLTADEWAEQLRRSLNTFLGVLRHARIQAGDTEHEKATGLRWACRFAEWRTKVDG